MVVAVDDSAVLGGKVRVSQTGMTKKRDNKGVVRVEPTDSLSIGKCGMKLGDITKNIGKI
jgi:hypothetical protein